MTKRIQYPLTTEAKVAAKYLVDAWKSEKVSQLFYLVDATAGNVKTIQIRVALGELDDSFESPLLQTLLELSQFNLIAVEDNSYFDPRIERRDKRWQVLLLQELQNAVNNNFEVSDYFLTFNAVGTIIHGDATITAPFQSGASIFGGVSQEMTYSEIADEITKILGNDLLQTNSDLSVAIDELRSSIENDKQSKIGKVISELGRCLQHGANTFVVMQTIGFLAQNLR